MTNLNKRHFFKFSWKTTIICGLLVALMLRASHWQWTRHLEKKDLIKELTLRMEEPVLPQDKLMNFQDEWNKLVHRKVKLTGSFQYDKEIVLKNRRYDSTPGFYVITPFNINNSNKAVLVNRGFIPANKSDQESRKEFQNYPGQISFYGLVKDTMKRKFLAPQDPPAGEDNKWVDAWLRVDIEHIQKQIPFKLLPVYIEFISTTSSEISIKQIVKSDVGKTDMLFLPERASTLQAKEQTRSYPIPQVNTYVPAGRHFGYVFEWAIMALITLIIGFIAQLRRS